MCPVSEMNSFCQLSVCKKLTEMKSLPEKLDLRGQSPLPCPPSSQSDEGGIPSMADLSEHTTREEASPGSGEIVLVGSGVPSRCDHN